MAVHPSRQTMIHPLPLNVSSAHLDRTPRRRVSSPAQPPLVRRARFRPESITPASRCRTMLNTVSVCAHVLRFVWARRADLAATERIRQAWMNTWRRRIAALATELGGSFVADSQLATRGRTTVQGIRTVSIGSSGWDGAMRSTYDPLSDWLRSRARASAMRSCSAWSAIPGTPAETVSSSIKEPSSST